jgi:hypothetical protein
VSNSISIAFEVIPGAGVESTATPGRSLLVATSDVGGYYL